MWISFPSNNYLKCFLFCYKVQINLDRKVFNIKKISDYVIIANFFMLQLYLLLKLWFIFNDISKEFYFHWCRYFLLILEIKSGFLESLFELFHLNFFLHHFKLLSAVYMELNLLDLKMDRLGVQMQCKNLLISRFNLIRLYYLMPILPTLTFFSTSEY